MVTTGGTRAAGRTPLLVLTGFLGSGKTTVLAALLRAPHGERIAVLVNEIGALPLDHHLLERVDEDVLALPSGCVCCALRGELHAALARVAARGPTRVVLETTGLADPAPLLHALETDPRVAASVRPAGVVTVVDALRAEELLDQPELVRQLEVADRVVLTKGDLAPARVPAVRALLAETAPGCEVRLARDGRVDAAWLLDAPPLARVRALDDARRWLHHAPEALRAGAADDRAARASAAPDGVDSAAPRGPDVTTHAVRLEHAADVGALQLWLRLATQLDGPRLLRVKALAECRATGAVFALQAAGRSVSPPRRLGVRPAGVRGVSAVVVERGLGAQAAARLLASLRAAAAGHARAR